MILLVDAYNVVHVTGVLPAEIAGIDTAALVQFIERSRYRHCRVEVICDGVPGRGDLRPGKRSGLIGVRYAGERGVEADDLIAAMIRASSTPRRLIVVSSDHAVQREAKRRKCRSLSSEDFLRQLGEDYLNDSGRPTSSPPTGTGALTEAEVDAWMREFGVDAPVEVDKEMRVAPQRETASARREAEEDIEDGSGSPLPESLIAEAERLWREYG